MKLLFYLSNLFFFIFWLTRSHILLKFLATFLLSVYCFLDNSFYKGIRYVLFSIGDFVIEVFHIHYAILIFGIAKSSFYLPFLFLSLLLFYLIPKQKWILLYFTIFFFELYDKFTTSNLLFLFSDLIIVFSMYIKKIPYGCYFSYPIYWISLLNE